MPNAILAPSTIHRWPGFTCVALGDSITEGNHYFLGVVKSVTCKDGVATIENTGSGLSTGFHPGAEFQLTAATGIESPFSGRQRVTERVSSLVARFAITPDAPPAMRLPSGNVSIKQFSHQSDLGWFWWLNSRMHGAFTLLNNAGTGAAEVSTIASTIDTEVLPYHPRICFVLAGTNDMKNFTPLDQTIPQLQQIYERLLSAGITVVAMTIPPLSSSYSLFTHATPRIMYTNQWIRDYAAANAGIILVDTWAALVDSTSATGEAATDMMQTDGIHPSVLGARAMGDAITNVLADYVAPSRNALASRYDSYGSGAKTLSSLIRAGNIATGTTSNHGFVKGGKVLITGATPSNLNGLFDILSHTATTFTYLAPGVDGTATGTILAGQSRNMYDFGLFHTATGGTVTAPASGTAAAGVTVSRGGSATVVASVVAAPTDFSPDALAVGNAQRIVVTAGAAADSGTIRSTAAELANRLLAGHRYYAEAYVKLTNVSGSNLRALLFYLGVRNSAGTFFESHAFYKSLKPFPTTDMVLHLRTPSMLIPNDTYIDHFWSLQSEYSAAGTAITIDIGRVRVVQVD